MLNTAFQKGTKHSQLECLPPLIETSSTVARSTVIFIHLGESFSSLAHSFALSLSLSLSLFWREEAVLCYTETQHNEQPLTPWLFIEVTGEEGEKIGEGT